MFFRKWPENVSLLTRMQNSETVCVLSWSLCKDDQHPDSEVSKSGMLLREQAGEILRDLLEELTNRTVLLPLLEQSRNFTGQNADIVWYLDLVCTTTKKHGSSLQLILSSLDVFSEHLLSSSTQEMQIENLKLGFNSREKGIVQEKLFRQVLELFEQEVPVVR